MAIYVLLKHGNIYKSYSEQSQAWNNIVSSTPTVDHFQNGNTLEEVALIPESAWAELSGEVEILYYTDDSSVEEVQFNIETKPFTLKDEFEGKEVSIVEYTDNPIQEETVVEIETEPFYLYHEIGDSFEVLYYTDDSSATSADLKITANYSPLDEIKEDFDIVTWSSEGVETLLEFNMNALPLGQFISDKENLPFNGGLNQVVVSRLEEVGKDNGVIRMLVSFDSGSTFKSYKDNTWSVVNTTNYANIIANGNTLEEITAIPRGEWERLEIVDGIDNIRFGYYIEESVRGVDSAKIDKIQVNQDNLNSTPSINNSSLYILNTKSTIEIKLQGRNILGKISDEDKTKVQYKVFLNGDVYYPSDGGFSSLQDSPSIISLNLDHRKIKMNETNYLTVEFQDYWGASDSWTTEFVGEPIGLLFKDPKGGYYANEIGEVLKYLDIGTIIAGQTSLEHEVLLENKIGYKIKNANIRAYSNESGISIELSKTNSPFEETDEITFAEQIVEGGSVPFYIRIKTDARVKPRLGGEFQLRVYADKADE